MKRKVIINGAFKKKRRETKGSGEECWRTSLFINKRKTEEEKIIEKLKDVGKIDEMKKISDDESLNMEVKTDCREEEDYKWKKSVEEDLLLQTLEKKEENIEKENQDETMLDKEAEKKKHYNKDGMEKSREKDIWTQREKYNEYYKKTDKERKEERHKKKKRKHDREDRDERKRTKRHEKKKKLRQKR